MRAAVIVAPGVARVEDVPRPHPGPGQVRVRLEGCGVCASNLGPWQGGPWFEYPLRPGSRSLEGTPVPGEALGCAINVFERSDIRAGQSVAIVGIGFLGALLTRLSTRA